MIATTLSCDAIGCDSEVDYASAEAPLKGLPPGWTNVQHGIVADGLYESAGFHRRQHLCPWHEIATTYEVRTRSAELVNALTMAKADAPAPARAATAPAPPPGGAA
jgi:hypothetical protein